MKRLPASASDKEILDVVRQWVGLLAAADFQGAYALTDHDPYYAWTPDLIRRVIEGYGSSEPTSTRHSATPIADASGGPPAREEVTWWDVPRHLEDETQAIGFISFDLPLDGTWSDLTATFEIRRRADELHLVLQEIHVL